MTLHSAQLAALVGSRICHDLISPVGAIGNGLELLELSGAAGAEEMALIRDSLNNAKARIRFFRVAFGGANDGQMINTGEVRSILADLAGGARQTVEWQVTRDCSRADVRLAFLALLCVQSALPFGGTITITEDAGAWQLRGTCGRVTIDAALWERLNKPAGTPAASEIEFTLLPQLLAAEGRSPRATLGTDEVVLRF